MSIFYGELARWWPLVSPVDDYAGEAGEFIRVLDAAVPEGRTVLELGSGGGHNAFFLKQRFAMTLSDASAEMLEVSKQLNPDCTHVQGDMRTLELGQKFDAVFVHDAVDYMTTEADLSATFATAHRHLKPGGVALIVPDVMRESFAVSTDCGGSDAPDGRGVRFLEWSYDPDPSDTVTTVQYTFVTREADGRVQTLSETHETGLFSRADWVRLLEASGFTVEVLTEVTDDDRDPRLFFMARR